MTGDGAVYRAVYRPHEALAVLLAAGYNAADAQATYDAAATSGFELAADAHGPLVTAHEVDAMLDRLHRANVDLEDLREAGHVYAETRRVTRQAKADLDVAIRACHDRGRPESLIATTAGVNRLTVRKALGKS